MFVNRRKKSNISKVSRVWGGGGRVHIITSLALPEDVSGRVEGGGVEEHTCPCVYERVAQQ